MAERSGMGPGCSARRKFFDLYANNKSQIAEQALGYFGQLYKIDRDLQDLDAATRRQMRQTRAKPVADAFHTWMCGASVEGSGRIGDSPSAQ